MLKKIPESRFSISQRLLRLLALGYITAHAEDQLLPRNHSPIGADFNVKDSAVLATVARLQEDTGLINTPSHLEQFLACPLSIPIPRVELTNLLGGVSQHLGKSPVCLNHFGILIENNYPISGLVHQDTPSGGFVGQRLFRLLAFGDILINHLESLFAVPDQFSAGRR